MKKRSLIAIILAVVCLMTSLSVYAVEAEKCETCGPYTKTCADDPILLDSYIEMSHPVTLNGENLTCHYYIEVYRTVRTCTVCGSVDFDTTHRHAEIGHICGRAEDRCPY